MELFFKLFLAPLFLNLALAWMVGNLPTDELPPQSCLLKIHTDRNEEVSCSANIVAKDRLFTSAHCLYKKNIRDAYIYCPDDTPKPVLTWTLAKNYNLGSHDDLAVLQVDGNFKSEPARLPKSAKEFEDLLEKAKNGKNPDCRIAGYGKDETGVSGKHRGRAVTFSEWHLYNKTRQGKTWYGRGYVEAVPHYDWYDPQEKLLYFKADVEKPAGPALHQKAAIREGDSGGGFYCTLNPEDPPTLFGVTEGSADISSKTNEHRAAMSVSIAHRLDLVKELLNKNNEKTETGQPLVLIERSKRRLSPKTH